MNWTYNSLVLLAIVVVLIFSPFLCTNLNNYLENLAYDLKWNIYTIYKKYNITILIIMITTIFLIFVCFDINLETIKRFFLEKTKKRNFNHILTAKEYELQKKINTELSIKRLESSREYQNYLKQKNSGKYPKIVLEEDEIIKFSDEE